MAMAKMRQNGESIPDQMNVVEYRSATMGTIVGITHFIYAQSYP
jgi:hypothetical protein